MNRLGQVATLVTVVLFLFTIAKEVEARGSKESVCTLLGLHHRGHQDDSRGSEFGPLNLASDFAGHLVLNKQERVGIACEMKQAILSKYSLIHLKKQRLGLDAEAHLESCAQDELDQPDDNLAFMDRLTKCIAGFHDSHFDLRMQIPRGWVYTGFQILEADDGKFYISQTMPEVLSYVRDRSSFENFQKIIAVGNEVIEIDGVPVEKAIERLKPYLGASSDGALRRYAVNRLTARNFLYPDDRYLKVKVRWGNKGENTSVAKAPWWSSFSASRVDTATYFQKIGIDSTQKIRWVYNEEESKWEPKTEFKKIGFDLSAPLFESKTYVVNSRPALRLAEVIQSREQVFCYMQILTFSALKVSEEGSDESVSIVDPIRSFVNQCKAKSLPMIVDLRSNPGGYGSLPARVATLLLKEGAAKPGRFLTFRNSKDVGWMLASLLEPDHIWARDLADFGDWNWFFDSFLKASTQGASHLDIVNSKIESDTKVGGYDQKIVVLVTPHCVSACDNMANILKTAERATLVGTHTNGTGAGFFAVDKVDSRWKDSLNAIALRIPNSLFGVLPASAKEGMLSFQDYSHYVSENQPTTAQIQYQISLEDIKEQGKGWREKAIEVLFR